MSRMLAGGDSDCAGQHILLNIQIADNKKAGRRAAVADFAVAADAVNFLFF